MWQRLGGVAGVGFAALYFIAMFGVLDLPEGADSDEEVINLVSGEGQTRGIVGVVLLAAAGTLFLWFLAALTDVLRTANETLTRLASLSGSVFVAMLSIATACFGVLPLATALDELSDDVSAEVARVLTQLGFVALLLLGLFAAATLVLSASAAILTSRVLPRWIAWLGLIVGPLLFLGAFWVPQLLLLVWAAATGVVLARRGVSESHAG